MGRGKSKSTQDKMLEYNIQKVKYILFNNQKDSNGNPFDFHVFHGMVEGNAEKVWGQQTAEFIEQFSQEHIIRSILRKQDTLAVLPTGGGKSYCFQGPALCFEGITLVITPLVALIEDQVKKFNQKYATLYSNYKNKENGIVGNEYYHGELYRAIYPGMKNLSQRRLFDEIAHPVEWDDWDSEHKVQYKLLYVSPERLSNPKFVREFKKREAAGEIRVDFVVVDEAHCMSQWGFDFRESYLQVGTFINQLVKRPVVAAFSATVTRLDIKQIFTLLKFKNNSPRFLSFSKRNNLKLSVIHCSDDRKMKGKTTRIYELFRILNRADNKNKPCIIYCTSIESLERLYETMNSEQFEKYHFYPAKYHGQLSSSEKKKNLARFMPQMDEKGQMCSKTNIMIATKAFGMGIDRDNIELVIHFDMPRSLEDYYQEIGRAGRSDRIQADCYLLYSQESMNSAIRWALESSVSDGIEKQPIIARFSENMRKTTRFYVYYRMAQMWNFCMSCLKDAGERYESAGKKDYQEYILDYFKKAEIDQETIGLLNNFYHYVERNILPNIKNEMVIRQRSCFCAKDLSDTSYWDFLNKNDDCLKELTRIVGQVNELHINNTRIANYLRWYSDKYDIKVDEQDNPLPVTLSIEEWKRKEENISDYRENLMTTDIQENSAFIRMKKPQIDVDKYIVPVWQAYIKQNCFRAEVIFAVNEYTNKIDNILRFIGNKWEVISDKDPLKKFQNSSVTGLLPKERYAEWYANEMLFVFVKGKRNRDVSFAFRVNPELNVEQDSYNDYKLNYFDMCVADAIYSIIISGQKNIYIKTIWEVLSGDSENVFSRADSKTKAAIEESIYKMQNLQITIKDAECREFICNECFLPITRRSGEGEKGYSYEKIPPLYRYAEAINGELIKVPVSLMNAGKVQLLKGKGETISFDNKKYKYFCVNGTADIKVVRAQQEQISLPVSRESITLRLMSNTAEEQFIKLDLPGSDRPRAFSGSIDNVVLFHYLLHRIAIGRGRNRGKYIQFETVRRIVEPYLSKRSRNERGIIERKILSIMRYYSAIEFVECGGYIKNFSYIMKYQGKPSGDGLSEKKDRIVTKTKVFKLLDKLSICYWCENGEIGKIYLSDINFDGFDKSLVAEVLGDMFTEEMEKNILENRISYNNYDGVYILKNNQ